MLMVLACAEPVVEGPTAEPSEAREEQLPRESTATEPPVSASAPIAEPVAGARADALEAQLLPANSVQSRARVQAVAEGAARFARRLVTAIFARGERSATERGDTGTGTAHGAGPSPEQAAVAAPTGPTRGPLLAAGNTPPEYAAQLRHARVEGTAWIHAVVEPDGSVSSASLARTAGTSELDQAALDAVRRWRFEPALDNGQPVRSEVDLPIVFRIRSRPAD